MTNIYLKELHICQFKKKDFLLYFYHFLSVGIQMLLFLLWQQPRRQGAEVLVSHFRSICCRNERQVSSKINMEGSLICLCVGRVCRPRRRASRLPNVYPTGMEGWLLSCKGAADHYSLKEKTEAQPSRKIIRANWANWFLKDTFNGLLWLPQTPLFPWFHKQQFGQSIYLNFIGSESQPAGQVEAGAWCEWELVRR